MLFEGAYVGKRCGDDGKVAEEAIGGVLACMMMGLPLNMEGELK